MIETHIQPYSSLGDGSMRQIAPAILLALLLHALILIAFYFQPSELPSAQRQTIDVSLETPATASSTPLLEKRPLPTPQATPKPIPIADEAPSIIPAPPVSEAPPPSPVAAPAQNVAAPSEEIQPLYRLTRLPSFSKKTEAVYPAIERRAGIQANVLAEVTIDSQGMVLDVRILKSGGTTFDEAVKQALQRSVFNPGMIDGKPVGTRFQVPFRFNLN